MRPISLFLCIAYLVSRAAVHAEEYGKQCRLQQKELPALNNRDYLADDSAKVALVQVSRHLARPQACQELKNEGSYFSVAIEVGTPPQKFQLVADTGSNNLIVASCLCGAMNLGCSTKDSCFTGTNRSSSFILPSLSGTSTGEDGDFSTVSLSFGSGSLTALVATDVVRLGSATARMDHGVFLMVDRRTLKVDAHFEGILGLGQPQLDELRDEATSMLLWTMKQRTQPAPMFLEAANISSYSVCFNDGDKPGIMRLGTPVSNDALASVGKFHWGLGLSGLSIGNVSNLIVCAPSSSMPSEQVTPCAAIPDTGTTLITGPTEQISKLYGELCEAWDRCRKTLAASVTLPKHEVFTDLVSRCADWLDEGDGLMEIPSIFLHLTGADGTSKIVELTSWAYITELMQDNQQYMNAGLDGLLPLVSSIDVGKKAKVCSASFGVMEYSTKENGPVWILGLPLFFEYTMGFDISGRTGERPPTISFEDVECPDSCDSSHLSLFGSARTSMPKSSRGRAVRKFNGPPRIRHIDVKQPL